MILVILVQGVIHNVHLELASLCCDMETRKKIFFETTAWINKRKEIFIDKKNNRIFIPFSSDWIPSETLRKELNIKRDDNSEPRLLHPALTIDNKYNQSEVLRTIEKEKLFGEVHFEYADGFVAFHGKHASRRVIDSMDKWENFLFHEFVIELYLLPEPWKVLDIKLVLNDEITVWKLKIRSFNTTHYKLLHESKPSIQLHLNPDTVVIEEIKLDSFIEVYNRLSRARKKVKRLYSKEFFPFKEWVKYFPDLDITEDIKNELIVKFITRGKVAHVLTSNSRKELLHNVGMHNSSAVTNAFAEEVDNYISSSSVLSEIIHFLTSSQFQTTTTYSKIFKNWHSLLKEKTVRVFSTNSRVFTAKDIRHYSIISLYAKGGNRELMCVEKFFIYFFNFPECRKHFSDNLKYSVDNAKASTLDVSSSDIVGILHPMTNLRCFSPIFPKIDENGKLPYFDAVDQTIDPSDWIEPELCFIQEASIPQKRLRTIKSIHPLALEMGFYVEIANITSILSPIINEERTYQLLNDGYNENIIVPMFCYLFDRKTDVDKTIIPYQFLDPCELYNQMIRKGSSFLEPNELFFIHQYPYFDKWIRANTTNSIITRVEKPIKKEIHSSDDSDFDEDRRETKIKFSLRNDVFWLFNRFIPEKRKKCEITDGCTILYDLQANSLHSDIFDGSMYDVSKVWIEPCNEEESGYLKFILPARVSHRKNYKPKLITYETSDELTKIMGRMTLENNSFALLKPEMEEWPKGFSHRFEPLNPELWDNKLSKVIESLIPRFANRYAQLNVLLYIRSSCQQTGADNVITGRWSVVSREYKQKECTLFFYLCDKHHLHHVIPLHKRSMHNYTFGHNYTSYPSFDLLKTKNEREILEKTLIELSKPFRDRLNEIKYTVPVKWVEGSNWFDSISEIERYVAIINNFNPYYILLPKESGKNIKITEQFSRSGSITFPVVAENKIGYRHYVEAEKFLMVFDENFSPPLIIQLLVKKVDGNNEFKVKNKLTFDRRKLDISRYTHQYDSTTYTYTLACYLEKDMEEGSTLKKAIKIKNQEDLFFGYTNKKENFFAKAKDIGKYLSGKKVNLLLFYLLESETENHLVIG